MRVQAFCPELAVERFDEGVVGWFAGPGEVKGDAALVRPQIQVARHELGALVDPDRSPNPTSRPTSSSTSTTSAPRKLNRGSTAGEKRENVSMIELATARILRVLTSSIRSKIVGHSSLQLAGDRVLNGFRCAAYNPIVTHYRTGGGRLDMVN